MKCSIRGGGVTITFRWHFGLSRRDHSAYQAINTKSSIEACLLHLLAATVSWQRWLDICTSALESFDHFSVSKMHPHIQNHSKPISNHINILDFAEMWMTFPAPIWLCFCLDYPNIWCWLPNLSCRQGPVPPNKHIVSF